MLGQPAAHNLSPRESESISPALVAVPIFSHLPGSIISSYGDGPFGGRATGSDDLLHFRVGAGAGFEMPAFLRACFWAFFRACFRQLSLMPSEAE